MNLYQGLLFLHGHILDPRHLDESVPSNVEGHTKRTANERAFRSFGKHGKGRRAAASTKQPAAGVCG